MQSAAQALDLGAGDAVLVFPATALSPLAMTDAWTDLLLPLLSGTTIVYPGETTPGEVQALLDREQISFALGTPAEWSHLLGSGWLGDRRINLICRGSRVSSVIADQLAKVSLPRMVDAFIGGYRGPVRGGAPRYLTPASQHVQWPLAPLPGDSLRILDASGSPVPFAVPGELVVQRDSAEFRPGYVARYSPDRGFEIIEQAERSVRLHGYRLRLGDLEDLALQEPSVARCGGRDSARRTGKPVLVAYVAGRNGDILRSRRPSALAQVRWRRSILPPPRSSRSSPFRAVSMVPLTSQLFPSPGSVSAGYGRGQRLRSAARRP